VRHALLVAREREDNVRRAQRLQLEAVPAFGRIEGLEDAVQFLDERDRLGLIDGLHGDAALHSRHGRSCRES
jgi:hypothetical protein